MIRPHRLRSRRSWDTKIAFYNGSEAYNDQLSRVEDYVKGSPEKAVARFLLGYHYMVCGAGGKVTFSVTQDGNYTWAFMNAGKSSEPKGTYGLDYKGLLVLTSDDTQMVSVIEMKEDSKLHFTLFGAPDGDPVLDFTKG